MNEEEIINLTNATRKILAFEIKREMEKQEKEGLIISKEIILEILEDLTK